MSRHRKRKLSVVESSTPVVRKYEAASRTPRMSSWYAPSSDATTAINSPTTIRNRARDLVRNNPWAAKGVATIVNNTVGYGIRGQIKTKSKARLSQVEAKWKVWAETTACDADGLLDFYGLQQLAFRAMVESGECLIRFRPRRAEDNLPVPFQIQIIEPDLIADSINQGQIAQLQGGSSQNQVIRGIEYDALGRRVAYYLYKVHPGSEVINLQPSQYSRVPADEVIHLFRADRPGQQRGVSWLSPVVLTLRELGIYEDAYLKRQQLANLFAGFMYSDNPSDLGDELEDEIPDLQPGTIYMMKNGRRIEFSSPPPAGEDPKYRDSCLRRVAAGMGISYESLTGNLSEVNFSSARMGANDAGRNFDGWLWNLFIPRFCNGVFGWFLKVLSMQGTNVADISAEWTPPARVIVDPGKEFSALLTAVRSGFMTLPEAIRQQGFDPDHVAQEQAEYLTKLDQLGVSVESDFRTQIATPPATNQPGVANG